MITIFVLSVLAVAVITFCLGYHIGYSTTDGDFDRIDELENAVRNLSYELVAKNRMLNRLGHRIGTQRKTMRRQRAELAKYKATAQAVKIPAAAGNNYTLTNVS